MMVPVRRRFTRIVIVYISTAAPAAITHGCRSLTRGELRRILPRYNEQIKNVKLADINEQDAID